MHTLSTLRKNVAIMQVLCTYEQNAMSMTKITFLIPASQVPFHDSRHFNER